MPETLKIKVNKLTARVGKDSHGETYISTDLIINDRLFELETRNARDIIWEPNAQEPKGYPIVKTSFINYHVSGDFRCSNPWSNSFIKIIVHDNQVASQSELINFHNSVLNNLSNSIVILRDLKSAS